MCVNCVHSSLLSHYPARLFTALSSGADFTRDLPERLLRGRANHVEFLVVLHKDAALEPAGSQSARHKHPHSGADGPLNGGFATAQSQ